MTLKWNLMKLHQRNEAVADQRARKRRPQPNLNQPKRRPVSYLTDYFWLELNITFVSAGGRRGRPKKKEEEPKSSEEDGEENDDEDAEEGDDE